MQGESQGRRSGSVARSGSRHLGFTLVEVLVALLVTSVTLMGLARLDIGSLKHAKGALERSQALGLAQSMLDAMRANRKLALAGDYQTPVSSTEGTPAIVRDDVAYWEQLLASTLPSPAGSISVSGDTVTVDVKWHCTASAGAGSAATCAQQASLDAQL